MAQTVRSIPAGALPTAYGARLSGAGRLEHRLQLATAMKHAWLALLGISVFGALVSAVLAYGEPFGEAAEAAPLAG
jgi:hypothetical protein